LTSLYVIACNSLLYLFVRRLQSRYYNCKLYPICTFVYVLYAKVLAKCIIPAHICLLPCNVNVLAVQNGQNGRINLQLHSNIVQHRQSKPNVEAHAIGSLLLVEFEIHFADQNYIF
jgi:hypothetical protein